MATSSLLPVEVSELVRQIESEIIFGQLRPFQELTEDNLMERFDSKRHVVRSAINQLVLRRIVVKERSKPARVKNFTGQEVCEIYHMRALLQANAAAIMPLPVSSDDLALLQQAFEQHMLAVKNNESQLEIHYQNDNFHNVLFSLCKNSELCKAIQTYTEMSNPIRSYGIADPKWLAKSVEDHAAMVTAIENQDRARLEELMVSHMQPTRKRWELLNIV